jgi:iron complex transport system ATP-binding protein
MAERAAVVATGVTLAYGSTTALAHSDFTVPEGRVTAIIGPNGSGKSTMLHAIAGLLRPATGRLAVWGSAPGDQRARIAYVLQSTKVNELMPVTVAEIVAMGRYSQRGWLSRLTRTDRSIVAEAMDRLEIADLAARHLNELSGGQRQRVFVAQGLAQQADLLLLDEPVTGLDLVSHERILTIVKEETTERGVTVVMTTHDLGEAAAADHLLLLAGRVVAAGTADEVITPAHLSEAYGARLVRLTDGSLLLDDASHHHGPSASTSHLTGHDHTH